MGCSQKPPDVAEPVVDPTSPHDGADDGEAAPDTSSRNRAAARRQSVSPVKKQEETVQDSPPSAPERKRRAKQAPESPPEQTQQPPQPAAREAESPSPSRQSPASAKSRSRASPNKQSLSAADSRLAEDLKKKRAAELSKHKSTISAHEAELAALQRSLEEAEEAARKAEAEQAAADAEAKRVAEVAGLPAPSEEIHALVVHKQPNELVEYLRKTLSIHTPNCGPNSIHLFQKLEAVRFAFEKLRANGAHTADAASSIAAIVGTQRELAAAARGKQKSHFQWHTRVADCLGTIATLLKR
eukprot:gnl/Spiro4/11348_TR5989_c0_g1_i1.p1 gnl/Spiro4/11348_TR5989_c0_g1~~gnl/Spiro4/11348_TR5989_c0_g1_i1.p1  ORF type:complete len:299 (-),score=52.13 gnl/Spiro4/11348_TR5989_c0_g1_i1:31-927(-)